MIVRVRPSGVELADSQDLSHFHVDAAEEVADVGAVLEAGGFGTVDRSSGEALIDVGAIRRAVDGEVPASWEDSFTAILAYAASKGWLTDDGTAIRAHIERGS